MKKIKCLQNWSMELSIQNELEWTQSGTWYWNETTYLVWLNDTAYEEEENVLLKLTQLPRLHHPLQTRHPAATILGQL